MVDFASYEKQIRTTIIYINHIVRVKTNSSAIDIKESLKDVPNNAIFISCDESEFDDCWELLFEEQQK